MRLKALLLVLSLCGSALAGSGLRDHPDVTAARAAYNEARYGEAASQFLALAQRWPEDSALYLALARARLWNRDAAGAVVAYRFYLELAPKAADREKVQAELALALKQADDPIPEGAPPAAAALAAQALARAQEDRFAGEEGALAAYQASLKAGLLGPTVARTRADLGKLLQARIEALIERWWQTDTLAEPDALDELERALTEASASLDLAWQTAAIKGLTHLNRGRPEAAVDELARAAAKDGRLRFAHAVALARAERLEDALSELERIPKAQAKDRRVIWLAGLLSKKLGRSDAHASLRHALMSD